MTDSDRTSFLPVSLSIDFDPFQSSKRQAVQSSAPPKRVKHEDHPVVVDPSQIEGTSSGYVDPASIKDGDQIRFENYFVWFTSKA